ncbi:hypothetical protein [Cohnella sp. GbtcB17]|uniref:hypothetical protein n=1 Tax=Cohnella sp. GbtcB17 TaxID=2824762 RepID=UPI001C30B69D|nr:hypothetical protein [Cohnella sp. GbtcB17]
MAIFTSILNLLKKNPATDGADTFNIQTMLNDNWDKIDAAMALNGVDGDVRVATTANITLSGLQTVDGVVLAAGDRVLVKNQTTGSQNGIYVATSGAWTRAADADSSAKVAAGISVYVRAGTANGAKGFSLSNASAVTLGTTALTFVQSTGAGLNADTVDGFHAVSGTATPNTVAARNAAGDLHANSLASSVATGTQPIYVASTTLVPNLNAEMVGGRKLAGLYQFETTVISDADALTTSGVYATPATFTGSPFAGTDGSNQGYLENIVWGQNTSYIMQRHMPINSLSETSQRFRIKNNGTWGAWRKMWDSGNDGAGSGLDADLLEGYHAQFASAINTIPIRDGNGVIFVGGLDVSGNVMATTFRSNAGFTFLNVAGAAQIVKSGGLLASDDYGDVSKLGTLGAGIYAKGGIWGHGNIQADGAFISQVGTAAGGNAFLSARSTGGTARWQFGMIGTEAGSNTGGDFALWNYADDGAYLNKALGIERKTGNATFAGSVSILGSMGAQGNITSTTSGNTATLSGSAVTFNRNNANYVRAETASGYLNFIVNGDSQNDGNATLRLATDYSANFKGRVYAPVFSDGNSFSKKVGEIAFASNGGVNQKADVYLPANTNFNGYFDITVVGTWNFVNGTGQVTKRFAINAGPTGTLNLQESRYTEAIGATKNVISIGNLAWDATNTRWRIPIAFKVSNSNSGSELYTVFVSGASQSATAASNVMNAQLGSVYTTDSTVLPTPVVTSPDLVAKSASVSEFNVTSSTGQAALLFTPPSAGNYQALIYLRITATTTVNLNVQYTDAGGAQTTSVIGGQSMTAGSYSLLPVFINATTAQVSIQISSSVSGAAKVSASILGV